MISGDQILPIITSNVSVLPTEPDANPLKVWMESHDRFLSTPDDTLVLPAHNLPFLGIRKRLRDLISHHEGPHAGHRGALRGTRPRPGNCCRCFSPASSIRAR